MCCKQQIFEIVSKSVIQCPICGVRLVDRLVQARNRFTVALQIMRILFKRIRLNPVNNGAKIGRKVNTCFVQSTDLDFERNDKLLPSQAATKKI